MKEITLDAVIGHGFEFSLLFPGLLEAVRIGVVGHQNIAMNTYLVGTDSYAQAVDESPAILPATRHMLESARIGQA